MQGLKNYAEAVKYGPPGMINWDSNEVRQQFKNGATVLGIDWDDTPIIGELEKGTKVKVTCKGKGCASKQATLTATGAKIKLAKRFKKRKLAAGTVITITVSDSTGSKRFRYTLRAGKFPKRSIA